MYKEISSKTQNDTTEAKEQQLAALRTRRESLIEKAHIEDWMTSTTDVIKKAFTATIDQLSKTKKKFTTGEVQKIFAEQIAAIDPDLRPSYTIHDIDNST